MLHVITAQITQWQVVSESRRPSGHDSQVIITGEHQPCLCLKVNGFAHLNYFLQLQKGFTACFMQRYKYESLRQDALPSCRVPVDEPVQSTAMRMTASWHRINPLGLTSRATHSQPDVAKA
jgi:hypothetical protein